MNYLKIFNNRKIYDTFCEKVFNKCLQDLEIVEFKQMLILTTAVTSIIPHKNGDNTVTITHSTKEKIGGCFEYYSSRSITLEKLVLLPVGGYKMNLAIPYVLTSLGKKLVQLSTESRVFFVPVFNGRCDYKALYQLIVKDKRAVNHKNLTEILTEYRMKYSKYKNFSEEKRNEYNPVDSYAKYSTEINKKASKYVPVTVTKTAYKEALLVAKQYGNHIVHMVRRIYANQNIAIFDHEQRTGRETNEYVLLPRRVRSKLFPVRVELDIEGAMPNVLHKMLKLLKIARISYGKFKYSIYYDEALHEPNYGFEYITKNKKKARYIVGSKFEIDSSIELKSKILQLCFNYIPDEIKIKLGKIYFNQLIGGKRISYGKDLMKDHSFLNILIDYLQDNGFTEEEIQSITIEEWKNYFNKVTRRINRLSFIKYLKSELRILKRSTLFDELIIEKDINPNIPSLYQYIEARIMKRGIEFLKKQLKHNDDISLILIYDGIDLIANNNVFDERQYNFIIDRLEQILNEELDIVVNEILNLHIIDDNRYIKLSKEKYILPNTLIFKQRRSA